MEIRRGLGRKEKKGSLTIMGPELDVESMNKTRSLRTKAEVASELHEC